jgi:hypothetical protein
VTYTRPEIPFEPSDTPREPMLDGPEYPDAVDLQGRTVCHRCDGLGVVWTDDSVRECGDCLGSGVS